MMKRSLVSVAIACAVLSGCGTTTMGDGSPAMVNNGRLVGPGGMTLYTFDRDIADTGKSACNGSCATNWPPLMAKADAKPSGDYSVVTRDDGTKQWAMKGQPLYYWSKDAKAGDTTGEGIQGVWHVVKP